MASATTWLLVMTWSWLSRTNPEPVAPPPGVPSAPPLAWICTVLGSTLAATAAMLPLSALSGDAAPLSVPPITGRLLRFPCAMVSETMVAATTPPSEPTTSASTVSTGHAHPGIRAVGPCARCGGRGGWPGGYGGA